MPNYGSALFEQYGPYVTFVDPISKQSSYFDDSGTEWKSGTGPITNQQAGNTVANAAIGFNSMATTPAPVSTVTTPANSSVATTSGISNYVSEAETWLGGNLIPNVPNWALVIGAFGLFYIFGGKHR